MPPPRLHAYLHPHVTMTFDLLIPKFHALALWNTGGNWHQNEFIRLQNIMSTSLLTNR